MVEYLAVGPWHWSNMDTHTLQGLVDGGQLTASTNSSRLALIIPPARHHEPQPPEGYVVSFAHLHKQGFNGPTSRFMRGLCYYYEVELHNFAPNAISQAATFVGLCEGFLGIPVSWDLWLHLFQTELFTQHTESKGKCRLVCAGSLTFVLREKGNGVYPPAT
jgi:hypothetical protein